MLDMIRFRGLDLQSMNEELDNFWMEADCIFSRHYLGYAETEEETEEYKRYSQIWDEACEILKEKEEAEYNNYDEGMTAELYTNDYYLNNM